MVKQLLLFLLLVSGISLPQGWTLLSTVPTSPAINSIAVVDENVIWIACAGAQAYLSEDGGITWTLRNTGLASAGDLYGISATDNMNCWVGTVAGSIYRTSDGGNSWSLQIAVSGSFMDGIKMWDNNNGVYYADPTASGQPYQLRYTTDGGTTWTLAPNSPIAGSEFGVINAWDYLDDQNTYWLGSANTTPNATSAKIYYTTTGFAGTWNSATVSGLGGTQGLYYQAIGFTDAMHGMAGSNGNNIVKTTNGGVSWTPTNLPPGLTVFAAINFTGLKDGSNTNWLVLSDGASYYVFKTTDQGSTYTQETIPPQAVTNGIQDMVFLNSSLGFAGGGAGVFLKYVGIVPVEFTSFTASSESGRIVLNWKTATETNNSGFEIQRRINNEGDWATVGFEKGNGTTTQPCDYTFTDDIQNINATSMAYRLRQVDLDGSSQFSNTVLVDNILPTAYELSQNFPNPFNPSTVISYALPYSSFVSLKVYNSLGQEVSTLVNETIQAGTYKVNFNASGLSSGVYYYVLRTGNNNEFVKTNKMILLK